MSTLILRTLAAAALCFFLQGCVLSLQPLYTKETVTFEPKLVGTWSNKDVTWKFTKDGNKESYLVTLDEKDGNTGEFDGVLVQIGDKLFLDLHPEDPKSEDRSPYWRYHFMKAHTFLHVSKVGPKLEMRLMNPAWMKDYLEENPKAIAATFVRDRPVLTASPAELQKFVAKLAEMEVAKDDEGPFSKTLVLDKQD